VTIRLLQPESAAEWIQGRELVEEYVASLDMDLTYENIGHELDNLASAYGPPDGGFLLALENGGGLGCAVLRRFSDDAAEIKRLYVRPTARGRGVGRLLALGIISLARQRGYTRLLLDTLPSMTDAQNLYASLGFVPIEPYCYNPVPGTTFMQLEL